MARMDEIPVDQMTPQQKEMYDNIMSGPRGRIAGPMVPWFRSPELGDLSQKVGAFLRFSSCLENRITEFTILLVSRKWSAQVEWWAHHPLALKAGLDPAIADAIEARQRPNFVNHDEEVVYNLAMELMENHKASDATYQAALDELGEQGLVELIGVLGYYNYVAMVLNCFEMMPPGEPPLKGD